MAHLVPVAKRETRRKLRRHYSGASKKVGRRMVQGPSASTSKTKMQYLSEGFGDGYREGVQAGIQRFPTIIEGTSIIIPTFNQLDVLRQCIESIYKYTDVPYEIIIVDNASTDATLSFLQGLGGQIRFRVLDSNRGFAGAINVGMMMAKGSTIVLLNNDTLVTPNWLTNLLACLSSDDNIGMVGPVTNYTSGSQKIAVSYQDVADMPAFAIRHNRPDPSKWRRTDRLTGFCLLFRRALFEGIGYFDEGYEIGNFENDDYNIRIRLLGKTMVIAEDTFIHHYGSVSMKALGEQFQAVNDRNHYYFMDKWQNAHDWIHRVRQHVALREGPLPHSAYFYPENMIVQAIGANQYWIEDGKRRLVIGVISLPVNRVSQIDLRRWPVGEPIAASEVESCWRGVHEARTTDNGLVMMPDGATYHIEGNKLRQIISPTAMLAWNLHTKPLRSLTPEQLAYKVHGLPIISPPLLRQML